MSYILDALRKSESDRLRAAEAKKDESGVQPPHSPKYATGKRLPLILGAFLFAVISIAVVVVIKTDNPSKGKNIIVKSVAPVNSAQNISSREAVAPKKVILQAQQEPKEYKSLPFIWEKPELYRKEIEPFAVSIHVYASEPSRRILFINNKEYRAGERTQQGPKVESIEPQGVILSYRGEFFKLPRPR